MTTTVVPQVLEDLNEGFVESSTSTEFKKTKFRHKWSISDFDYYCKATKGDKIQSAIFSDGSKNGLKWRLEINSNGWYNCFLTLHLFLVSKPFGNFQARCKLSILNKRLEEEIEKKSFVNFTESSLSWDNHQFITKNLLLDPNTNYLLDNKLTILCEIVVFGNRENISSQLGMPIDLGRLLFDNPDLSVVTFAIAGRELHALKAILVARSPVFAAMFNHDMKEKKTKRIEITDVDYEVLKEMLRFIYTNKISNLESMADRLLMVADKYALENLKRRCEESMSKNLSIENAAQYLVLADQHNGDELEIRAKTFITTNAPAVVKTYGFKSLFGKHPQLFKFLHLSE